MVESRADEQEDVLSAFPRNAFHPELSTDRIAHDETFAPRPRTLRARQRAFLTIGHLTGATFAAHCHSCCTVWLQHNLPTFHASAAPARPSARASLTL